MFFGRNSLNPCGPHLGAFQINDPVDFSFSDERFEALVKKNSGFYSVAVLERILDMKNCIAQIEVGDSLGTGFVVSYDNVDYLVTNNHVLPSPQSVARASVTRRDTIEPARVRGARLELDERAFFTCLSLDCTFVKVRSAPRGLQPIELTKPKTAPAVGQPVFIMGHPDGQVLSFSHGPNSIATIKDSRVCHIAPTLPGSSGSPLFNADGELIALHSRAGDRVWHHDSYKFNIAFDISRIIDWFEAEVGRFGSGGKSEAESSDMLVDSLSEN